MVKNIFIVLFSFLLVLPAAAQTTAATSSRNVRESVRQTVQEQIKGARENFKKTMEVKRVELQKTVKTYRDELKVKLQNIKDDRKKAAVEKIDKGLADLNSRTTTHYAKVLDQIEDVLARVVSRADKAQANGLDAVKVRAAVTDAENAISAARTAVAAQASRVYTMNITGDAGLKDAVGAARKGLHDDLKKVGESVKAAREAVRQAAVTLAQIRGVDKLKTPASTATSTSQ